LAVKWSFGIHSTNLKGPVPMGLSVPPFAELIMAGAIM